jgi:uncharacterized repeat protein (TIGR01451 family)
MTKVRGIGRAAVVAAVAVAGMTLALARPAHAATACGAMITNTAEAAAWESLNGSLVSGTNLAGSIIQTSTAWVQVNGSIFTGWKDWTNISKGGKVPPIPGDIVQFAITVSNTGTVPMAGMGIVDTAPAGMTVVAASGTVLQGATPGCTSLWTVSYAAGVFTAVQAGGVWGKGDTVVVRYNAMVNSVCVVTNVTNTAWIGASDACIAPMLSATSFQAVLPVMTTSVTKTHSLASIPNGGVFSYYIVVTNTGLATITTLRICDTLPLQVSYNSDTSTPGLVHSFAGQRHSWDGTLALPLAPSQSASVVINATADSCWAGNVSNTVWVGAFDSCVPANKNASGSMVCDSFVLAPPPLTISVVKTVTPTNPVTGGPVSYKIIVTNTGSATITTLKITDTLTANVTYTAQTSSPAMTWNGNTSGVLGWYSGALTLNPLQSVTVTIDGTAACFTGNVSNTAFVVAGNGCATAFAGAQVSFALAAPPLTITVGKTHSPASPASGATVNFLVTVNNTNATSTVSNIKLVDTIPANIVFGTQDQTLAPSLAFLNSGGILSWSGTITLGPLQTFTVTWTGTVALCNSGWVSNTAWAYVSDACSNTQAKGLDNGFALAPATNGVTISKSHTPAQPGNGAQAEFTILITNTGSATITSVKVVDTLHPQLTFQAEDHSDPRLAGLAFNGLTVSTSGVAAWNGNLTLGPAQSVTIVMVGRTSDCFAGGISNTAWIYAGTVCGSSQWSGADPVVMSLAAPGPALTVSKVAIPAAPANGAAVNYIITVNNTSPTVALTGIKVSDTLPAGFIYGSENHTDPRLAGLAFTGPTANVIAWTGALTLAPLTSATLQIYGTASNCFVGNVSNTAWAYGTAACGFDQKSAHADFTLTNPPVTVQVAKTRLTASPQLGGPVSYRIDLTNNSLATIASVTIMDTLPSMVSYLNEEHPAGMVLTQSGQKVAWDATALTFGPGQVMSVTVTGTIQLCFTGAVTNTAWVFGTGVCGGSAQAAVLENGVLLTQQTSAITVSKTHAPANPGNGNPVTYQITVNNTGTGTITSLKITDTLDAAVTYVSADFSEQPGLVWNGNTTGILAWVGPVSIPPAGTFTLTITGTTALYYTGFVSNTGYVVASTACTTTTGKGIDSGYTLSTPAVSVSVLKTAIPANPGNGNPVQFVVTLTNTSVATLTDVKIIDTLSAQVVFAGVEEHPAGMTFVQNGQILAWNGFGIVLSPSASLTVTITGTTALCYTGNVSNTAFGWGGYVSGSDYKSSTVSFALNAITPTINVSKTATNATPLPGEQYSYHIVITNTGPATVTNLLVVDTLPAQFTYTANDSSEEPGLVFTNSGPRISWSGAVTLSPAEILTITVTGDAALCYAGITTNTAWAIGSNACGSSQMKANAYVTLATPVLAASINKTISPASPGNGMPVTFRIDVSNTSLATIESIAIVDTLAAQITYLGHDEPAGLAFTNVAGRLVWQGNYTVSPMTSFSVTVTGQTAICFTGNVSNTAWFNARAENGCSSVQGKAVDGFQLGSVPVTISVAKKIPSAPTLGAPFTYEITLTNTSAVATIDNIIIVDTLPGLVSYVIEDHPAGMVLSLAGQVVAWNGFGMTLSPLASLTVTVTGQAPLCYTGTISNTAWIWAGNACANAQAKDVASFNLAIPALSMSVQKRAVPADPGNGNPVSYEITVLNTGVATISSIIIVDTLSPNVTFSGNDQPAGITFSNVGSIYTWTGNNLTGFVPLAQNREFTVTLTGTTAQCFSGNVSNTGWVYASNACSNTQQKSVASYALAAPSMTLSIQKTVIPAVPVNGGAIAYQIVVTNTSAATITSIKIVDTLAAQFSFSSDDHDAVAFPGLNFLNSGGILSWTGVVNLAPMQSITVTAFGTASLCYNGAVSNTAWAYGWNACSNTQGKSVLGYNLNPGSMNITVSKTAIPAAPANGGPVSYRVVVNNTGPATVTNLWVADTLPAAFIYSAGTNEEPAGMTFNQVGNWIEWFGAGLTFGPSQSMTFTVTGNTSLCFTGNVSNTAWAFASNGCFSTQQKGGAHYTLFAQPLTVTLNKTVVPATVGPSGQVSFILSVTNNSLNTVENIALTDTLPAGITFASQDPGILSFTNSSPLMVWEATGISLGPNQVLSVTVTGTAACGASGTVSNTAWVHVSNTCKDFQVKAVNSVFLSNPAPTLSVAKTVSPPSPVNGGPITYTVIVTNTSQATITDLLVVDTLSTAFLYGAQTSDPVATAFSRVGNTNIWNWTGLNMGPGQSVTVTTGGTTMVCFAGVVTNTGYAEGWNACFVNSRARARGYAPQFLLTGVAPTIAATKWSDPVTQSNGGAMTYTIRITNNGLDTIANIEIVDTVPTAFLMASQTFDGPVGHGVTYTLWGAMNIWSGPIDLGPGMSCTVSMVGTVDGCASGTVFNSAVCWAMNNCGFDRKTVMTAPFNLTVPTRAITITKTHTPANPLPGEAIRYNILVTNTGGATLTSLIVQDTLPAGLDLSSVIESVDYATGGSWGVYGSGMTPPSNLRTFTVGTVNGLGAPMTWNPGMSVTLVIDAVTDGCFTGQVVNTAMADAWDQTCSLNHARRSAVDTPFNLVAPKPVVTASKDWMNIIDPAHPSKQPYPGMGTPVRYTVTFKNKSDVTAVNFYIVDSMPVNTSIESISMSSVSLPAADTFPVPWQQWTMTRTASTDGTHAVWTMTRTGNPYLAIPTADNTLYPGESVSYTVDLKVGTTSVGAFPVDNYADSFFTSPVCASVKLQSNTAGATLWIAPTGRLTIKIFNSVGELVFNTIQIPIGVVPTKMNLTFTNAPGCPASATVVEDPKTAPLSPDDDCVNDRLIIGFKDLPGFSLTWTGVNNNGKFVVNGEYVVMAESTDPVSGNTETMSQTIVVSAKHVEVVARIFNAAGEEVAVLPTESLKATIDHIAIEPYGCGLPCNSPFSPTIDGLDPADKTKPNVALIHLYDADGVEIDTNPTLAGIQPLEWDGKRTQTGQLVNNGVYMVQITSMDKDGGRLVATSAISVSHGKLDLISAVKAVPNPVSRAVMAEDQFARIWIRYDVPSEALSKVVVKIYNLAGELVEKMDVTDQADGADPLGRKPNANCSAPSGACGTFWWNGKNKDKTLCVPGMYIVVIEASDGANVQREVVKIALQ